MTTVERFLRRIAAAAVVAVACLLAIPAPVSADPGASLAVSGVEIGRAHV